MTSLAAARPQAPTLASTTRPTRVSGNLAPRTASAPRTNIAEEAETPLSYHNSLCVVIPTLPGLFWNGAMPPNFFSEYSVTLDHPMSTVFPVLAASGGLERTAKLNPFCTTFELLERDVVAAPLPLPGCRDLPSAPASTEEIAPTPGGPRLLPRQALRLVEEIPVLGGLFTQHVRVAGAQVWDEQDKVALYETTVEGPGIAIWKLRQFEEGEGGKTVVSERIEGTCPPWMRWIVQYQAQKGHRSHMDSYRTLFD